MERLYGIFPALITPFDSSGGLNEAALRRVVRYNINKGVQGFYVGGSTGEALLMSMEERKRALEIVMDEVAGKKPVLAHIGCIYTGDSIELAKHAKEVGVDAISSLPPFYYKFTIKELTGYYLDIVEAVPLPMIVYNAPALTGVSFDNSNLGDIFASEQVVGIKFTSYDLYQMQRLIKGNPNKVIINGHDEIYLSSLTVGSQCAIGSTFNFMAEVFIKIYEAYLAGELEKAAQLQDRANDVIEKLISVGVFRGVKGILNILGLDCGECRRPFLPLTSHEYKLLEEVLVKLQ